MARILIIEDDATNLKLAKLLVHRAGRSTATDIGSNKRIFSPGSPGSKPCDSTALSAEPRPMATPAPMALPRNPKQT